MIPFLLSESTMHLDYIKTPRSTFSTMSIQMDHDQ
jgi:hypothetical protein